MPNRILREGILTSRRVDGLSERAELFYRRLMSRLDDYGRCDADVELMRSGCYPLRVDRVKARHIEEWLQECQKAILLVIYVVAGKRYLQYLDWKQEERSESKFPEHPKQLLADAKQMLANAHLVVSEGVVVVGDVVEGVSMSGKPDVVNGHDFLSQAKDVLQYLNRNAGKNYRPVDTNLKLIVARLKSGATPLQLREVVFTKCSQWGSDEKMAEYLRPATLFNATKFEQYLGEQSLGVS